MAFINKVKYDLLISKDSHGHWTFSSTKTDAFLSLQYSNCLLRGLMDDEQPAWCYRHNGSHSLSILSGCFLGPVHHDPLCLGYGPAGNSLPKQTRSCHSSAPHHKSQHACKHLQAPRSSDSLSNSLLFQLHLLQLSSLLALLHLHFSYCY